MHQRTSSALVYVVVVAGGAGKEAEEEMTDLVWTPIKIRLGQIIPWSDNPRMSTKAQAQRLIKSERELGQIQTLAVSPFEDGRVYLYDGHQRCAAWMTVKDPSFEVTALQSNRMLTDDERKKVSVLLHTATGSWSWEALSSWSAADLREWGMDEDTLKGWNNDANNLKEMLGVENVQTAPPDTGIDVKNQYGVIVICDDEAHQEQVYNSLTEQGYKTKVVVV